MHIYIIFLIQLYSKNVLLDFYDVNSGRRYDFKIWSQNFEIPTPPWVFVVEAWKYFFRTQEPRIKKLYWKHREDS